MAVLVTTPVRGNYKLDQLFLQALTWQTPGGKRETARRLGISQRLLDELFFGSVNEIPNKDYVHISRGLSKFSRKSVRLARENKEAMDLTSRWQHENIFPRVNKTSKGRRWFTQRLETWEKRHFENWRSHAGSPPTKKRPYKRRPAIMQKRSRASYRRGYRKSA